MSLIPTGAQSARQTRNSRLILGWRAGDGSLDPYTGQQAVFTSTAGAGLGPVVGITGVSILGGSAMPRFTQADADLVTRLEMRGDSGSFDVELYGIVLSLPVQAMSVLVRVVSMYAKGSNQASAREILSWGSDSFIGAGVLRIRRRSTGWEVTRDRQGTTFSGIVTEPGSITYPVDVMVTLSAAGAQVITTRDAAGVTASASAGTNTAMVTAGELLQGLGLGCSMVGGDTGGWWRIEAAKIARGVLTFAQMDGLS